MVDPQWTCMASIARGHHGLRSPMECLSCLLTSSVSRWPICHTYDPRGPSQAQETSQNMLKLTRSSFVYAQKNIYSMSTYFICICVAHTPHRWPLGPPSGPRNRPKYTQTNQIFLCPYWNKVPRGRCGLKSPIETLCHVNLLNLYPDDPWATSMTLGAPLFPPKTGQNTPKLIRTVHCPCSNRAARGDHGLKSRPPTTKLWAFILLEYMQINLLQWARIFSDLCVKQLCEYAFWYNQSWRWTHEVY